MGHVVLFPLALVVPILLAFILMVPPYLGMYAASYLIYIAPDQANPLAGRILEVFYIFDVYSSLLRYWSQHHATLSFIHYTLPLIGIPAVCSIGALWLTRKVARKFIDVFHTYAAN